MLRAAGFPHLLTLRAPVKTIALIGFAEALSAPEVCWSLVDGGLQVIAFARRGRRSAVGHSRYVSVVQVTSPEDDEGATVREIEALMRSLATPQRRVVLFPLDDSAVWLCGQVPVDCRPEPDLGASDQKASAINQGSFSRAGPSGDQLIVSLDKSAQIEAAKLAGFRVPATTIAQSVEQLLLPDQSFPLILKPAKAVVSRDGRLRKVRNWICGDRRELESAAKSWAGSVPLLIQPYIAGTGCGIFGLATADGVEAISGHRRLRMMNPHGSGSSACASEDVSAENLHVTKQFIEQIGWRGLFMIETLRDAAGVHWFMELNGRPWGSIALARRQGLEYPLWTTRIALDHLWKFDGSPHASPGLVCRNIGRELMHLLFVLRGPKSIALTQWPGFWKAFAGVVRFHRRAFYYNWRSDDARVFFADCYYTLRNNILKRRN